MVPNAALAGSARNVVLHAVSSHPPQLAIVHFGRKRDFENALRRAQHLPQSWIELQKFRGHIELDLRDTEWIQILARGNPRHDWLDCWFYDRGHRRRSFRLLVGFNLSAKKSRR